MYNCNITRDKVYLHMSYLMVAKRDTYVYDMNDVDKEIILPAGARAYNILSEHQTKYIEPDEICLYHINWGSVHFGYKDDWIEDPHG